MQCKHAIVSWCGSAVTVCIAGGSVPVFDEVVLSTSLLNSVISIDEVSG